MFPIVGLLAAAVSAAGLYSLHWYDRLSRLDRERADRLAYEYANKMYHSSLDQLTSHQLGRVQALVKGHF